MSAQVVAASVVTALVVALPTAMIPTPVFGREIPTTWWAWPVLAVTSVLSGLLFATYVREPGTSAPTGATIDRRGAAGGRALRARLRGQLACPALAAPGPIPEGADRLLSST